MMNWFDSVNGKDFVFKAVGLDIKYHKLLNKK